jgi:D-Tyr-tRNAtyr deacylase
MKLLMFHVNEFWYKTFSKTLNNVEKVEKEDKIGKGLVVFVQVEKDDEDRKDKVKKKAFENIKWLAKKVNTEEIILHSFGHLSESSESKSSPEFAQGIISEIKKALEERGYKTETTPFGYFLEFKIHVLGESLAKVFKSL